MGAWPVSVPEPGLQPETPVPRVRPHPGSGVLGRAGLSPRKARLPRQFLGPWTRLPHQASPTLGPCPVCPSAHKVTGSPHSCKPSPGLHAHPSACQTQRVDSGVNVGVDVGMKTVTHTPQKQRGRTSKFATLLVRKARHLALKKEESV